MQNQNHQMRTPRMVTRVPLPMTPSMQQKVILDSLSPAS